jgi:hypothetical protein
MDEINKAQIRTILQQYEQAYDHRDMNQVLSVWPTMLDAGQKKVRQEFRDKKSITLSLSIVDIDLHASTVTCKRTQQWVNADKGGGSLQDQVTFHLSRQGGHWLIDSTVR